MGQFAGTSFGIGTPSIYPPAQNPGGFSPYASQGLGTPSWSQQPYAQPFSNPFIGGSYGVGMPGVGAASWPLQQVALLLQSVPQQLQQVQLLQQQQLAQLQHLFQWMPAQLHQLQQLIQVVPLQIQQLQQQGQPFGAGASGPVAFGLVPPAFAGQPASHVM
jgi:hypothetical protein